MTMSLKSRRLAQLAALGSALLILGALTFQYFGFEPCRMCYWQRWPHYVAIGAGALLLVVPWGFAMVIGALAATTTGAIGVYHAGVEQGWWPGPSSCSGGGSLLGLSGDDLLSTETAARVVMCDEIAWQLAGISMAGWNALFSFALAALWLIALRRA